MLSNRGHLSARKDTGGMSRYLNNSLTARNKPESATSSGVFNRKVSFAGVRGSRESDKKPARKMPSVKTQVYKDDTVEIKFDQLDSENSIIFEANIEDE